MLHRINLPDCTQHLAWIVTFQSDLLHALCATDIHKADVTVAWVKARRPDIDDDWMERFCGWSIKGKSMLARMQAVAALPAVDKQIVITHYQNNLRFPEAFDDNIHPPPATTPLPAGLSVEATCAYRDFFDLFYAPIFYRDKGYPIKAADLDGKRFTKDNYLEAYHAANPDLKVCPLCDGGMDGAELDHWLAKKYLPELNCHPQNLVEICGACNSITNKGEKLALDTGVAEPFGNWFHPHVRPAVEYFEIKIEHGALTLASNDPMVEVRLEKLDKLINLSKRWTNEYRNQFDGIQRRIRHHHRRGKVFEHNGLRTQLESWRIDAEAEHGIRPHKILEVCLLSFALADGSESFVELLEYATSDA